MKNKHFTLWIILELLILLLIFIFTGVHFIYNEAIAGKVQIQNDNKIHILSGEWEQYANRYIYTDNLVDETPIYKKILLGPNKYIDNDAGTYQITINSLTDISEFKLCNYSINGYFKVFINGEFRCDSNSYNGLSHSLDIRSEDIINDQVVIAFELYDNENDPSSFNTLPNVMLNDNFHLINFSNLVIMISIVCGIFIIALINVAGLLSSNKKIHDYSFLIFCFFSIIHIITTQNLTTSFTAVSTFPTIAFKYISPISLIIATTSLYYTFINKILIINHKQSNSPFDILYLVLFLALTVTIFIVDPKYVPIFEVGYYALCICAMVAGIIYVAINKIEKSNKSHMISIFTIIGIFLLFDLFVKLDIIPFPKYEFIPIIFFFTSFNYIANAINLNTIKVIETQEIIELKEKIRNTEFTFLNSQIQSHFIYNTLNSIQALCHTNPNKAATLVEEFSIYLRTRLEFNKMPILINVADELENIKTYLNIEHERYGSRVKYKFQLDVADFMVPPLSIQPLVENAVKHGISKKVTGGTVIIKTYEDEKNIYVQVIDDGVGFDLAKLSEKQRVGTTNITHRFALHLGATLSIDSSPGKGTNVIITIPKN